MSAYYRHSLVLDQAETERPRRCRDCRQDVPPHVIHSRRYPRDEYCMWSTVDEHDERVSRHRGHYEKSGGRVVDWYPPPGRPTTPVSGSNRL